MKISRILFVTIIGITLVISPAYGDSKGKGADNGMSFERISS